MLGPKSTCNLQKVTYLLAPTGHLTNSSQRVRGKCCSGQRVCAFRKKSRTLWPQLPQWTFAKFKPQGTRKMLFGPKGTCILQKVTYPLAPTATMDACQIQAKAHGAFSAQAKESMVKIAMSRGLWREPIKWTQAGHEDPQAFALCVRCGGWRQRVRDLLKKARVFVEGGRRERG